MIAFMTAFNDLIAIVGEVTTRKVPYEVVTRRTGDVPIAYATPEKAKNLLGRIATHSVTDAVRDGRNFVTDHV